MASSWELSVFNRALSKIPDVKFFILHYDVDNGLQSNSKRQSLRTVMNQLNHWPHLNRLEREILRFYVLGHALPLFIQLPDIFVQWELCNSWTTSSNLDMIPKHINIVPLKTFVFLPYKNPTMQENIVPTGYLKGSARYRYYPLTSFSW